MSVWSELLEAVCDTDRVLLTGPIAPDGDSLGACLALQRILDDRGVKTVVAGTPSYRYRWLNGAERMVPDDQIEGDFEGVVILDGDRNRLTPPAHRAFERARVKAIIDHHGSTEPSGYTHAWLDARASSACEMLFHALPDWGVTLDPVLAAQLYTGAVFDTGGFRYSNTTPRTHKMAAELVASDIPHAVICTRVLLERRASGLRLAGHVFSHATFPLDGALAVGRATLDLKHRFDNVDGDLEGIVDALIHVLGVEVAMLLVERPDGEVKYSLRSRGKVDVSHIAREISSTGGGHPKAAGASVWVSVDEAETRAIRIIQAHLDRANTTSS